MVAALATEVTALVVNKPESHGGSLRVIVTVTAPGVYSVYVWIGIKERMRI